jgi:undecaprenyl-diphosphatase
VVVGALLVVALVCGAIVFAVVARWPVVDPASPRATAAVVRHEVDRHPSLARFARARLDPAVATGLLLTAGVAITIVGGAAVGVVFWMVRRNDGLARWDRHFAIWGADHATDFSTSVLRVVTQLGSTTYVIAFALVVALIELQRRPSRWLPLFLVLVVGGQNLIANVVKALVDRARPDIDPLAGFSGSSFPSGHSAAAAATFAACALLLGRERGRPAQALLAGGAVAIAAAVACSRVLLGVHWFTDVCAGLALGWAWFALCSVAFGGRLLRFGAPVELAERVEHLREEELTPAGRERAAGQADGSDARDDEVS